MPAIFATGGKPSRSAARERLGQVVEAVVRSPEWRETLERYRWLDRYQGGVEFAQFVDNEWLKGEWTGEVVCALLESEWRALP